MLVYRISLQKEVAGRADDASAADTILAGRSEPQTAHEDAEETRVCLIAQQVPEDGFVRAEGPWHSTGVDGQAQQQAHHSIQHGLTEHPHTQYTTTC